MQINYKKMNFSNLKLVAYVLCLFLYQMSVSAQTCTPDANGNVVCNDFSSSATLNIDARLALKHNPTLNKPIFTSRDDAKGVYVRNPDCWASNIDLTGYSVWNSSGNAGGGSGIPGSCKAGMMITPRHCIMAAHFHVYLGDSIRFVTNDNVTIRRKVISTIGPGVNTNWSTNYPDISVVTLDQDVPPSIKIYKFLPANYRSYLKNDGAGLPFFYSDQEKKALVVDVARINDGSNWYTTTKPTKANRLAMFETLAGGDSGSPVGLILNGELVLVGNITGYGGTSPVLGSSLSHFANLTSGGTQPEQNLNDLIVASDGSAGINTGYKISLFDFTATDVGSTKMDDLNQVFTSGKMLYVKMGTIEKTQIQVFNLFGELMLNQTVNQSEYSTELPVSGIYIVHLSSVSCDKSYRVLLK
jgi:hypothetical protein